MSRHHERGNVIAEFAIVSTIVMALILGIEEFGRALYTYHLVSNAARIGTRYAIVRGTDCVQTLAGCSAATSSQIQTYVRSVSPMVDSNNLEVTASWSKGPSCVDAGGAGCLVAVQASYTFTSPIPLLNMASIPMSSTSTMVISQ